MKQGASGWMETATPILKDNLIRMIAAGKLRPALVVSHSCEIDKGKQRVLVAPVDLLSTLEVAHQTKILALKSFAHMPLPEVPGLGHCYADLRAITAANAEAVRAAVRLGSMRPDALSNLQARLAGFFTRLVPQ